MPKLWTILFIATVSQGFFLSIGLGMKERWRNPAINLLSLLILSFTLTLSYYLAFWLKISSQLPAIASVAMQLTLVFGPLLWLYLKKVQKKEVKKAWLHFIPFAVCVATLYVSRGTSWIRPVNQTVIIIQILQLVAYSVAILRLSLPKELKVLAITFAGYSACFLAYYAMAWTGILQLQYDYIVSLGMAIFIYYTGYKGLQTQKVLPEENTEKYSNSALTSNALHYIINKLDQLMDNKKLYLNGDLKLQELADQLEVSVHSLSQAINSGKNQKFNDYLNELRVQEAQRLMTSESHRNLKLLAIALDSGFNNKTSFLNAFKKHTGQSPSEYREKLLAQAS